MNNTFPFFSKEVTDKSTTHRFLIVMGIMLFFSVLTIIMSFT
ncbi:MAG TPA: hypothetical protein VK808_02270 [Bacteroidia bacterium]|nr:hypothetical protein [Bacteroidia bacterium]